MKKSVTIGIVITVVIAISIIAVELNMNKETLQPNPPINTLPTVPPAGKTIKLNLTESVGVGSH